MPGICHPDANHSCNLGIWGFPVHVPSVSMLADCHSTQKYRQAAWRQACDGSLLTDLSSHCHLISFIELPAMTAPDVVRPGHLHHTKQPSEASDTMHSITSCSGTRLHASRECSIVSSNVQLQASHLCSAIGTTETGSHVQCWDPAFLGMQSCPCFHACHFFDLQLNTHCAVLYTSGVLKPGGVCISQQASAALTQAFGHPFWCSSASEPCARVAAGQCSHPDLCTGPHLVQQVQTGRLAGE